MAGIIVLVVKVGVGLVKSKTATLLKQLIDSVASVIDCRVTELSGDVAVSWFGVVVVPGAVELTSLASFISLHQSSSSECFRLLTVIGIVVKLSNNLGDKYLISHAHQS